MFIMELSGDFNFPKFVIKIYKEFPKNESEISQIFIRINRSSNYNQ